MNIYLAQNIHFEENRYNHFRVNISDNMPQKPVSVQYPHLTHKPVINSLPRNQFPPLITPGTVIIVQLATNLSHHSDTLVSK